MKRSLLVLFLAGCSAATSVGPTGEFYLLGTITSIQHSATASGILVEPLPESSPACGIQATADAETEYFTRAAGGERQRVGVGAEGARRLAEGATVEVYVTGPVAESCPVQARASAFVLLGE